MKNIFDKYNFNNEYYEQDISFVFEQIENGNYAILPNSLSNGKVLKINYDGNIDNDGYERGYLVLPYGSSIKEHTHTDSIEQYMIISGCLTINGENVLINECFIGDTHSIDTVLDLTIIRTIKISKELYEEYSNQKVKTIGGINE